MFAGKCKYFATSSKICMFCSTLITVHEGVIIISKNVNNAQAWRRGIDGSIQ